MMVYPYFILKFHHTYWVERCTALPLILDHSKKNLSNRMFRARPLSAKSDLLRDLSWPRKILHVSESSLLSSLSFISVACKLSLLMSLISDLACSMDLHLMSKWNSLFEISWSRGGIEGSYPHLDRLSLLLWRRPYCPAQGLWTWTWPGSGTTCCAFLGIGRSFNVTISWIWVKTFSS